jgi:Mg-chelatase subunit ChlD
MSMPSPLRPALLASALLLATASVAASEPQQARTIIVMDGSGSMWGQIDGRPKLEIARETVADVVGKLPANQTLGLIAYGHRRKGDCKDIELIVPPAPGTSGKVLNAVNDMRFLGMTPLSEAVRQAAQALRHTEQAATVVLVTDGLETCNLDPCAVANELEKSGVNFTAHVIGFGLTKDEGAKVACLATNTGGRYLQASDGAALSAALRQAVSEPAPAKPAATLSAPASAPMGSRVAIKWTGPAGKLDTVAIVEQVEGKPTTHDYAYVKDGNPLTLTMPGEPGAYTLQYRHRDQTVIATRPIQASPAQAALKAPDVAQAGSAVVIHWTGPNASLDNIQVAVQGSDSYISYTYLGSDSRQVELTMPEQPGNYELRYVFRDRETIATRPIRVVGKP